MSEDEGGPTTGESGAPGRAGRASDRGHDGTTGDSAVNGELPPPGLRGGPPGDGEAAIDFEAVRDRAS